MYFNTVTRVSLHEHGVTAEGLDGCYDCTAEVYILERYLERYPNMLETACGSQLAVTPSASAPATILRLDSTKFNDPAWQQQIKEREAARLPKMKIVIEREVDGQPQTEEQMAAAAAAAAESEMAVADSNMDDESAAAAAVAVPADAAAEYSSASTAASAAAASSDMGDAAPSVPLSAFDQLKQNVGKFSQELSRRLTNGGTRTLATVNASVIKKAAFSRKNRL